MQKNIHLFENDDPEKNALTRYAYVICDPPFKVNTGHFASSTQPRNERKPQVKYRVGQVLKHKKYGYRGVIVGWDETTKAPEFWINQMHGKTNPEWRKQPNYSGKSCS